MEDAAAVLDLYDLRYSDLIHLSSPSSSSYSKSDDLLSAPKEELERLGNIRKTLVETLGPNGPGLLSISSVPNASLLRRRLLPLARRLSLLDRETRKRILKDHNLGSDVPLKNPDRKVSSFAMQLKYSQFFESDIGIQSCEINPRLNSDEAYPDEAREYQDDKFKDLGNVFKELGYCMMDLGFRVAQVCDEAIGGHELERSLLESGTAKGRLIHYHSVVDNSVMKETKRRKGTTKNVANPKEDYSRSKEKQLKESNLGINDNAVASLGNFTNLWQQWHYDYGIFTVLTSPMFLLSSGLSEKLAEVSDQECVYPNGNSCLQIFNPNKNEVLMVKTSPESFIIQVGESADILSKGKLRSTLHCVCRPTNQENLSRETFVVFLQPAWSKKFSGFDHGIGKCSNHVSNGTNENNGRDDLSGITQEIDRLVPPLASRLKEGMTFAEFSRETTKQYYGGSGLQSNR